MKRKILHFMIILFSVVFLSGGISTTTYAYTEEEKQQAKAWLSAHGYSPDMGGASQAYQDYLNGKFDEELGIATTEDGSVLDTETTAEEQADTENKEEQAVIEQDENEGQSEDREETGDTNAGEVNAGEEQPAEESENTAATESDIQEETGEKVQTVSSSRENPDLREITLYQEKNMGTYKEAGMVLALSVLLTVVVERVLHLVTVTK